MIKDYTQRVPEYECSQMRPFTDDAVPRIIWRNTDYSVHRDESDKK